MDEEEWLTSNDVAKLLKRSGSKPDGRKLRLLICAWCRRRWDVLDGSYQYAVEVAERYADGLATEADINYARIAASSARKMYGIYFAYARKIKYTEAASAAAHLAYYPYETGDEQTARVRAAEKQVQLTLLREIFGNPFRPVAFDPAWRTSTAVALARGIYDERAFDRMPILADALQDAGCDCDEMLNHLRGEGPHVRGCWALDL